MNNNIFHIRALVFLSMLGLPAAIGAQEVADSLDVNARTVVSKAKKAPQYEMKTIKGIITDAATGEPMGGVRVQALGNKSYSGMTEEDGTYTLDVPTFVHALYIYAPEYAPAQVALKSNNEANVALLSDDFRSIYIDGTNITSSAEAVIEGSSSATVETDIERQLGGDIHTVLHNGSPAAGIFMNIHGINSLNASTQPLIVLDGNIVDTQRDRETLHEGFINNLLAGIDPETIESVKVLKNATALYGAKGANGVILINTKRGKSMATKINVNIFGGVELAPSLQKMMDGEQYRNYVLDLISTNKDVANSSNTQGMRTYGFMNEDPNYIYYPLYHNNTDWSDGLYRKAAFTQNYKVNVEGGDERGMYALQLGYTKGQGTVKENDFSRLSLRFNTDITIIENHLTTGLDIAYNQNSYNVFDNGWSENYDMQNIGSLNVLGLVQSPFLSKYAHYNNGGRLALTDDYSGKYAATDNATELQNPFGFISAPFDNQKTIRNPYWVLQNGVGQNKNYAELTQIDINFNPRWQVNKHLVISDRFNYRMDRNSEKYFLPINGTNKYTLNDLGKITSVLRSLFSKETTLNNDARIEWQNNYGAHDIDVFGGFRYNNFSYSTTLVRGYNNENDKLPIINATMQYVNYDGTKDNWTDMTWYAQARYSYANRYFVEAGASMMSSSRFGRQTKGGIRLAGVSWGLFPSVQAGWIISNERWFNGGDGVNYLKLTAGFDQSGNDEIDYYAAKTYWESQTMSKTTVGLVMQNMANSSIQWETTTKWNVALEGSFLKNRLQAGIDLFWNKTSNLLVRTKPHYLTGLANYWTNDGALTNRGFDAHVNAALINKKNWKWELGASVGHYNNKVTKMPTDNLITLKNSTSGAITGQLNGYTNSIYGTDNILTAVGYAVGSFYGYQTNGVYASTAQAEAEGLKYPTGLDSNPYVQFKGGDVRFVDQNGDGVIDESDKVVIGNPHPDIYGNIFSALTWKNLRLDVNFKYSLGNDVYNYQRSQIEAGSNVYNQTTAMVNRWTHEGQAATMPKACYTNSDDYRANERFSDRWIEDGSYLKLKNVRLTYTVPVSTSWLQGLKVWGEANNLFTLTKYHGIDPETSCSNATYYQGIDTGMLTVGRSFNLGLSINL